MSPERIEQVLADFREWLAGLHEPVDVPQPPDESVDLHTLVANFIALRQEVNLQTRATRSALEQNAELLRQLTEGAWDEPADADGHLRPLLKALIEVHDALALARKQVERLRDSLRPALDTTFAPESAEPPPLPDGPRRGLWARLTGSEDARRVLEEWRQKVTDDARGRAAQRREALAFIGQAFDSLVTGYTMGLERVERVLPAFDVEPIQALGQRFDPEAMEVLETVGDSGRAAGDVVEEVRRGYRWRGQVLRFALVRVAR